jgi:maleylacetoacetate isomerase
MQLYSFFRSSAAYRVRIALNLKGLSYQTVPLHLRREGGEHRRPSYTRLNPEGLVPALRSDGRLLTQSLAIIDYLEEVHPSPPLLPGTAADRAWIRALAQHVACEIHPINNLRVLQYLEGTLRLSEAGKRGWMGHWIRDGFDAIEERLEHDGVSGLCCFGDAPTMADCALLPQVANALRFEVDLGGYPRITAVCSHLRSLEPFRRAAPESQPDAE